MASDHSNSERGNPLPPHGLLFPINSKVLLYAPFHQTGLHIPWPLLHQSWSTGWNETPPGINNEVMGGGIVFFLRSTNFPDLLVPWTNENIFQFLPLYGGGVVNTSNVCLCSHLQQTRGLILVAPHQVLTIFNRHRG